MQKIFKSCHNMWLNSGQIPPYQCGVAGHLLQSRMLPLIQACCLLQSGMLLFIQVCHLLQGGGQQECLEIMGI